MVDTEELPVTWGRLLSVWWLIVWRGTLGAVVIGALLGGIFGFVVGAVGPSYGLSIEDVVSISRTGGSILGGVAATVVGVFVVRMALRKAYRSFRIVLVPRPA